MRSFYRLSFLKGFLEHPGQVATLCPSSGFLAARLLRIGDFEEARVVVELGAGTGTLTRPILRAMPRASRLLAVEVNGRFVHVLRDIPDSRLVVKHHSADDLNRLLRSSELAQPDVIVTGVPFSMLTFSKARHLLEQIWSALAPGGQLIAYQTRGRLAKLAEDF